VLSTPLSGQSACATGPNSVPIRNPRRSISAWYSESGLTDGQTETISLVPYEASSATAAPGSGHSTGSKRHSPRWVQWKKSATITFNGMPRR